MKFFSRKKRKDNNEFNSSNNLRQSILASAVPIPNHIAIVMDGNGRWAMSRGLPRMAGHRAGADKLRDVCRDCCDLNIKYLTCYAFSTENWQRPQEEVNALMQLVIDFFRKYDKEMAEQGIRLRFSGDLSALPEETLKTVKFSEKNSENRDRLQLIVCLNYGGRQEILRAAKKLAQNVSSSDHAEIEYSEDDFKKALFIPDVPDPDLFIRPGGEKRISNFLLWQLAYTELYFTDCLWPDFSTHELEKAVFDYQKRDRRFGKVKVK